MNIRKYIALQYFENYAILDYKITNKQLKLLYLSDILS